MLSEDKVNKSPKKTTHCIETGVVYSLRYSIGESECGKTRRQKGRTLPRPWSLYRKNNRKRVPAMTQKSYADTHRSVVFQRELFIFRSSLFIIIRRSTSGPIFRNICQKFSKHFSPNRPPQFCWINKIEIEFFTAYRG